MEANYRDQSSNQLPLPISAAKCYRLLKIYRKFASLLQPEHAAILRQAESPEAF